MLSTVKGWNMRINSIQTYSSNSNSSLKSNAASKVNFTSYRNVAQDGSNYVIERWKSNVMNILGRNSSQMEDLAEFFHRTDDKTIKEASKVYIANNPYLTIEKKSASESAYQRLRSAVDKVLDYKDKILREREDLLIKGSSENDDRVVEINDEIGRLNNKARQVYAVFSENKSYYIPEPDTSIYTP